MSITVPTWWLYVSALLFIVTLIATFSLLFFAIRLLGTVTDLVPKITSIGAKFQRISTNVNSLTADVKTVASALAERSAPIALATRDIAATATSSFAKYAPLVALVTGAINILEARNAGKKK
jgi:hypothetical protein